jgi:choline/glycine/proline betaine transport protein
MVDCLVSFCRYVCCISKGRTVREFILGVLLVPSIVTFSGFQLLKFSCASSVLGDDTIANAVNDNVATALFVF